MKLPSFKSDFTPNLVIYFFVLLFELLVVNLVSDLPVTVAGWSEKAREITQFQIPSNNFYGPGAAILLIPFLWLSDRPIIIVAFYLLAGAYAYWKICSLIEDKVFRIMSKLALPANTYLLWLIHSSQDTVFEFALLMWSCYFLIKKNYLSFVAVTYLLAQTRAGYWTFFLGVTIILLIIDFLRKSKLSFRKYLAIPLLIGTSAFNYLQYGSPSPALESGMTAYFSYAKYHYLALPKMDMDVFLSGPKGIFSNEFGPEVTKSESLADENSIYQKAAINSLFENKKETVLGWMQKFDSYIFGVQKIPHLPGRYVLDIEKKTIQIENDRLSSSLVMGNLLYLFYRSTLLVLGFSALGAWIVMRMLKYPGSKSIQNYWFLFLPYAFGIIPGMLFYTETRFKIVSELILFPLIFSIFSQLRNLKIDKSN